LRPVKVCCFWVLATETSAPRRGRLEAELAQTVNPKVNRREHLVPTVGHDVTWSHRYLPPSLLTWWETQGKDFWDLKEARLQPCNKSWRQVKLIPLGSEGMEVSALQQIMEASKTDPTNYRDTNDHLNMLRFLKITNIIVII